MAPLIASLHAVGHELGIVVQSAALDIYRPDVIRSHVAEDITSPHSVLDDLRARNYEIALIASEKPYAYTLAKAARIPQRVGFWNGFAKPLKSLWVRALCTQVRFHGVGTGGPHEVETLFRLGAGFCNETAPTRDVETLRYLFFRIAPARKQSLAIQITPKWLSYGDIDDLATMIHALNEKTRIRLIASAREEAFVTALMTQTTFAIERHQTAATWVERIASSRVLLTPDTGAAHVAGMVGTKVIDCFPPGVSAAFQRRWRPWASESALYSMSELRQRGAMTVIEEAYTQLSESL